MKTARFGPFRLDLDTEELFKDGARVPLAPKPSQGLALLVRRAGSLVRREELYEHLWSSTVVELDQGLNSVVRQIRAALDDDASSPSYIQTVPRKGYRFIGEVLEGNAHPSTTQRRMATGAMALALMGAAIWLGYRQLEPHRFGAPLSGQELPAEYAQLVSAADHLLHEETQEDAERALTLLDQVVARYPDHADAHADRATALTRLGRMPEAGAARDAALVADSSSAAAWLVHGTVLLREWKLNSATDALARAVELEPAEAAHHHGLAYALALRGDHASALRSMDRAKRLSPLSPAVHGDAGLFARWAGRLDDAEAECLLARQLVEERFLIRTSRCLLHVSQQRGDTAGALRHANEILDYAGLTPQQIDQVFNGGQGMEPYWRWAATAGNLKFSQGGAGPFSQALAFADLGDSAAALAAVQNALEQRSTALLHLRVEPRFRMLRGTAEFERVLAAVRAVDL